ncbi:MAG TPA: hypothetical protein VHI30_07925 [Gaiellales bacterium]|nr:hypothetical protein [Gaiellales bacterium]
MSYVRVADDAAARWRITLAGVVVAFAVAAPGLRLWPFLGAALLFGFWVGFGGGRHQARTWRRVIEATLAAGEPDAVEFDQAAVHALPRLVTGLAAGMILLAATHAAGGLMLAVWGSCLAVLGGWAFGRGTAVRALEGARGWALHWPAGSGDRPGIPRLVAVASAPAPRRAVYEWGIPLAAVASVLAMGLAVETVAAVRALASRPLPVIAGPSSRSHVDPVLGEVASRLAGTRAEVRCWSRRDWPRVTVLDPEPTGGFTDIGGGTINLPPAVCGALAILAYSPAHRFADATWRQIAAPHILAHEAAHLGEAGASESRAECAAVQTTERASELLGAAPGYARWMARLDWAHLYPRLSGAYRSAACTPGGPLDLHLAEGWPTG